MIVLASCCVAACPRWGSFQHWHHLSPDQDPPSWDLLAPWPDQPSPDQPCQPGDHTLTSDDYNSVSSSPDLSRYPYNHHHHLWCLPPELQDWSSRSQEDSTLELVMMISMMWRPWEVSTSVRRPRWGTGNYLLTSEFKNILCLQKIGAADSIGSIIRSCKDTVFLQNGLLSQKINRICKEKVINDN